MKTTNKSICLSLILCLVLIAALALMAVGCNDNTQETPQTSADTTVATDAGAESSAGTSASTGATQDVTVKGEGQTMFYFHVVDMDGNVTKFEIHTNQTTVGGALLELDLIAGDDGAYGLYVKTVNGITADYDKDGTWWGFYIGDEMAMTGVDTTDIEAGATYAFKVSK